VDDKPQDLETMDFDPIMKIAMGSPVSKARLKAKLSDRKVYHEGCEK